MPLSHVGERHCAVELTDTLGASYHFIGEETRQDDDDRLNCSFINLEYFSVQMPIISSSGHFGQLIFISTSPLSTFHIDKPLFCIERSQTALLALHLSL